MKIAIIGTGIYSTSLALNIAENQHQIMMWSENESLVRHFKKEHNLSPICDALIPNNIDLTNDIIALENVDFIIIGTSAKYVRSMTLKMQKHINLLTPICIASKGIENETCSFLSDIIKDTLKVKHIAVISGPTFAIDLIHKEPCALTVSGTTKKACNTVIQALSNSHLKIRNNFDIYGTQLCGSIKNVIAIASGILDGLGYTESTRAFLLTESLHDIKELLQKLECNPKTILSYAGIGDLILTASSPKSRNYQFGLLLGKNTNAEEIENYLKENTTEGYYTLLSIKQLMKNRKIKMPIIELIYDIVIKHKDPHILAEFLIQKD